jgi:hypothetical protein
LQWPLAALEPILIKVLPATAGQLSFFGNDATAELNWLMSELSDGMIGLADMIDGDPQDTARSTNCGAAGYEPIDGLVGESATFATYLCGEVAAHDVADHYRSAIESHGLNAADEAFDRMTLRLAGRGGPWLRLADAYCALFRPRGILRSRLILPMAILEYSPSTFEHFERTPDDGPVRAVFSLAMDGVSGVLGLAGGVLPPAPAHSIFGVVGRFSGQGERGAQ